MAAKPNQSASQITIRELILRIIELSPVATVTGLSALHSQYESMTISPIASDRWSITTSRFSSPLPGLEPVSYRAIVYTSSQTAGGEVVLDVTDGRMSQIRYHNYTNDPLKWPLPQHLGPALQTPEIYKRVRTV